ncbi:hypothetical protein [Riemerella columbipharyngis]|uniref:hypothetical protein n=1 Tax=Riemerella columbipharyngis TaxID=1071918 RepID=UPI00115F7F85|nr:hypothetical protein [Riemerella columbipharyngis]
MVERVLNNNTYQGTLNDLSCIKTFTHSLFASLIKGEYADNEIDIISYLPQKPEDELISNSFFQEQGGVSVVYEISNLYRRFIKEYRFYQNDNEDFIYIRTPTPEYNDQTLDLFIAGIEVSIIDIHFSELVVIFRELGDLRKKVENLTKASLQRYRGDILKKINFLLYKWKKRAFLNNKKIQFSFDGERDDYSETDFLIKQDNNCKEWKKLIDYIDSHYDGNKDSFVRKQCEDLLKTDFDLYNATAREYHALIKYHKDITKNVNCLENIVSAIDYRRKKNNNIIWEINYSYAKNNKFSLFVESCEDKYKLIEQYNYLKNDDKNYFLQFKTLNKALELLGKELTEVDITKVLNINLFLTEKLEPIYNAYKNNMEWSIEHSHKMLYRLPYEECLIGNIYIHSGFMLPPSNKEAYDNYEQIKRKHETLLMTIESLSKITPIADNVKELNDKVKKSEVKAVELIALFTASIAFIMGGVQGFAFVKSLWSALAFLSVFATSLISFLLALLLITRYNEGILKKFICHIIIVYTALIGIIYMSMRFAQDEENKDSEYNLNKNISSQHIDKNAHVPTNNSKKIIKDSMRK